MLMTQTRFTQVGTPVTQVPEVQRFKPPLYLKLVPSQVSTRRRGRNMQDVT